MLERGTKVPVLNNMALCLQRQGHTQRALDMLEQVLKIEEFNPKATARKLTYLFDSGKLDQLRKELNKIKLSPSLYDNFVRQTKVRLEKLLNEQSKKDKEIAQKMFSGPLYDDKPATTAVPEEPDLSPEEIERQEETEYLATLSNFHWVMYPFFKTLECLCDKVFGCKKKAQQVNEEFRQHREKEQLEKQRKWEEEKAKLKEAVEKQD